MPVFMKLEDEPCLVVGGGKIALHKIHQLVDSKALVTVVSPKISKSIYSLPITIINRPYQASDLKGVKLVIAATDDNKVNKKIYEIILKLRTHGAKKKFKYELVGINSRLDTIQAVILKHKLNRINLINQKRRKIANYYFKKIKNKKINLFNINNNSCFHQFVILVRDRKNFLNHLKNYRIPYGFHYPYAIHKLEAIKKYCIDKNFKNSILIAERGVSIPMDPFLNKKKLDYIINKINCF